jgi:hypothetical protein
MPRQHHTVDYSFQATVRLVSKAPKLRLEGPTSFYWPGPQKRDQTHSLFRRQMLVMGIAHLLLAITTIQLAILSNLSHDARLGTAIFWGPGGYFAFLAAGLFHFFR